MGQHTIMALTLFDTFPAFSRRLATPRGFGFPQFDFDRAFAETEQRRQSFLSNMEVDAESNGAQSYSYSSSTFRSGNNAPVTQSSEQYVAGGTSISRSRRSVGDQAIEETVRNGESTRTLHNITEDELSQLEAKIAEHRTIRSPSMLAAPPETSTQAGLPAALQQDLARLKQ